MSIVLLDTNIVSYMFKQDSRALCRQWADVRARCTNAGSPISPQDAWIAATSLRYHIPLVTHNPIDYANIPDLTLISEA